MPIQLDDPEVKDGDGRIRGFRSSPQPTALPPGIAARLENFRCEGETARVRKGPKAVATSLVLSNPAVVLSFTLGVMRDVKVNGLTRSGGTARFTYLGTDPGLVVGQWVKVRKATAAAYNGTVQITAKGNDGTNNWFEYAVVGTPTTPDVAASRFGTGPRIFNTYSDQVHISGRYAADDNVEGIVLATTNKVFVYREGLALASIDYPTNEIVEATDDCTIEQYLGSVFLCRGREGKAIAISGITRVTTTATVTTTSPHGLGTGNRVRVSGAAQTEYNIDADITVTDATHFNYQVVGTPATPATGSPAAIQLKVVLRWDRNFANAFVRVDKTAPVAGKIRFPETGWIIEHNRRLIGELSRDEVVPSDFGSYNEWTRQEVLRFRQGAADWLIGAHAIHRRSWLAFYRFTVHQAFFTVDDLKPSSSDQIAGAPGCRARSSVQTCGSAVLYLSDNGIYALEITSELNVRAQAEPLSRFIQDYINRINWAYAHRAVSAYHSNSYYIALPIDGAVKNNALFKFNFLNPSPDSTLGEWESVDTFVAGFDIRGLHVMKYQGLDRLHATTSYGYIFPLEVLEADEFGGPGSNGVRTYQIAGRMETRQTYAGDPAVKTWIGTQIETNLQVGDAFKVECATRNPDTRKTIYTHTSLVATDKTHPPRIRCQRGVAAGLVITTSHGRPEIRGWQVQGVTSDRSHRTKE